MTVEPTRTGLEMYDDRAIEVIAEEGSDGALVLNVEAYTLRFDDDWAPRIRVYLNDELVFGEPMRPGGDGVD